MMKLQLIGGCSDDSCPRIYISDRGTFVIQGTVLSEDDTRQMRFAVDENAVEIPENLLLEVAKRLR